MVEKKEKKGKRCLFDEKMECPLFTDPRIIENVWQFCIPCQLNEIKRLLEAIYRTGIPIVQ